MTRLAYLVNKDKTLSLFSITGDIRPVTAVTLKWEGKTPVVSMNSGLPWAMDEMADTIRAISTIIYEIQQVNQSATPLAVIELINESKGKQVVIDARGKVRNVSTAKDGLITYQAKGLDFEVEIEPDTTPIKIEQDEQVEGPETRQEQDERARKQLKKQVMAAMMDDNTEADDLEKMTAWIKAGAKVVLVEDGKLPVALDPKVVFK